MSKKAHTLAVEVTSGMECVESNHNGDGSGGGGQKTTISYEHAPASLCDLFRCKKQIKARRAGEEGGRQL